MKTVPWIWISSKLSPFSDSCPRPPLCASRYMLSVIGEPPLTSAPETCTEVALSARILAPSMIWAGVFLAIPLPSEELPQPAIAAARRTSPSSGTAGDGRRARIAAQTLAWHVVGYPALLGEL